MLDPDEEDLYPLQECVFEGDLEKLASILPTSDVSMKDKHGNTALHLAVMLGRMECIQMLLNRDAPIRAKNLAGWTPLHEAVSYGNRRVITLLMQKLKDEAKAEIERRRNSDGQILSRIQNFHMSVRCEFSSWIPFVTKLLPYDEYELYKFGTELRVDLWLGNMGEDATQRTKLTLIFQNLVTPNETLIILDHKANIFQKVIYEEAEHLTENEVDVLMSHEILAMKIVIKDVKFARAQSGWIFKSDKAETVAGVYQSDIYNLTGFVIDYQTRSEHLSPSDLERVRKEEMECHSTRSAQDARTPPQHVRRVSLLPPPAPALSWAHYLAAPPGQHGNLGRKQVLQKVNTKMKATVAMSKEFPLTMDMLLSVIDIAAPAKSSAKIRQFAETKLPPGFPVKIDIPIYPTITATLTFDKFVLLQELEPDFFAIPEGYVEGVVGDHGRLPAFRPS